MKPSPEGLGTESRRRLSALLRGTKGTISAAEAAKILGVPQPRAAQLLSFWARRGWLSRVRRGLYVPVPLESRTADVALEDPWVVAARLFAPCYIGGWSAAEHWGLTEQIFRSVLVVTAARPRQRELTLKGTAFVLRNAKPKAMFGLSAVWRNQVKVNVSDPARTVVDMLADPALGGGIRPTADILRAFLASESAKAELLLDYGDRLGNGAVFKRLGFLIEQLEPARAELLSACRERLTTGYAKLDPTLAADRLVTGWRVWVPARWQAGRKKRG